jgi:2-methylcitrate dehydratase
MEDDMNDDNDLPTMPTVGRRKLLQLGAGVVMSSLAAQQASSQGRGGPSGPAPPRGSAPPADELRPRTGPGYKNHYNRLGNNGPMDDATRTIVKFVREYNASSMTPATIAMTNRTMVDSMAAAVAGFETEGVRHCARLARQVQSTEHGLTSTVLGYGFPTTAEHGAFVNSAMVRYVDFNDTPHDSNMIPAALAIGEALHSSGADVLAAIVIGYEVMRTGSGESVAPAMAAGKLLGLDEDRLANAVSLALVPHVALNKGVGAMSMWKGLRSAEAIKCGVWAALMAKEGITANPQPFEGRGALWSRNGPGAWAKTGLPISKDQMAIDVTWHKRFPSDQQSQGVLNIMPEIRAWTRADEIEAIQYDLTYGNWQEVGGNAKWDPRNHDTADHSLPYVLARNLIDGESYLDAFEDHKLPYRDPQVKALMDRMTFAPVKNWEGNGTGRLTIKKKTGEVKFFDTHGGVRHATPNDYLRRMTDEDVTAKFVRVCKFRHVADAVRDKALREWWDLRAIKDIGEPIRTLAKFGTPKPL